VRLLKHSVAISVPLPLLWLLQFLRHHHQHRRLWRARAFVLLLQDFGAFAAANHLKRLLSAAMGKK
jgi:hypothetical protein